MSVIHLCIFFLNHNFSFSVLSILCIIPFKFQFLNKQTNNFFIKTNNITSFRYISFKLLLAWDFQIWIKIIIIIQVTYDTMNGTWNFVNF
jgi:hypothetical protein